MSLEDEINSLKRIVGEGLSRPDVSERIEALLGMDNGDPTSLGILTGEISRERILDGHFLQKRRNQRIFVLTR